MNVPICDDLVTSLNSLGRFIVLEVKLTRTEQTALAVFVHFEAIIGMCEDFQSPGCFPHLSTSARRGNPSPAGGLLQSGTLLSVPLSISLRTCVNLAFRFPEHNPSVCKRGRAPLTSTSVTKRWCKKNVFAKNSFRLSLVLPNATQNCSIIISVPICNYLL